jgi:hypothetical protein
MKARAIMSRKRALTSSFRGIEATCVFMVPLCLWFC